MRTNVAFSWPRRSATATTDSPAASSTLAKWCTGAGGAAGAGVATKAEAAEGEAGAGIAAGVAGKGTARLLSKGLSEFGGRALGAAGGIHLAVGAKNFLDNTKFAKAHKTAKSIGDAAAVTGISAYTGSKFGGPAGAAVGAAGALGYEAWEHIFKTKRVPLPPPTAAAIQRQNADRNRESSGLTLQLLQAQEKDPAAFEKATDGKSLTTAQITAIVQSILNPTPAGDGTSSRAAGGAGGDDARGAQKIEVTINLDGKTVAKSVIAQINRRAS